MTLLVLLATSMLVGFGLGKNEILAVIAQAELAIGYGLVHSINGFLRQLHACLKCNRHAVALVTYFCILSSEGHAGRCHSRIFHSHRQRCLLTVMVCISDYKIKIINAFGIWICCIAIGAISVYCQCSVDSFDLYGIAVFQLQFLAIYRDLL